MLGDALSLYFVTALTPAVYVFTAVCSQNLAANLLMFWIVLSLVATTATGVMLRDVDCDGFLYRGEELVAIVDYGAEECNIATTEAFIFVFWMLLIATLTFASVYYAVAFLRHGKVGSVLRASNTLVHYNADHCMPTLGEIALMGLSLLALGNAVRLGAAPIPVAHALAIAGLLGCATWSGEQSFVALALVVTVVVGAHGAAYGVDECAAFFSFVHDTAHCDSARTAVRVLLATIASSGLFRLCHRTGCLS